VVPQYIVCTKGYLAMKIPEILATWLSGCSDPVLRKLSVCKWNKLDLTNAGGIHRDVIQLSRVDVLCESCDATETMEISRQWQASAVEKCSMLGSQSRHTNSRTYSNEVKLKVKTAGCDGIPGYGYWDTIDAPCLYQHIHKRVKYTNVGWSEGGGQSGYPEHQKLFWFCVLRTGRNRFKCIAWTSGY
jgi:hypothetical protein